MNGNPLADMLRIDGSGALVRAAALLPSEIMVRVGGREPGAGRSPSVRLVEAQRVLDRLTGGWTPNDADLGGAPILHSWSIVACSDGLSMMGEVAGHPVLGSSRRILTSVLIAFDAARFGWGRTVSRFYRLGRPAGSGLSS